MSKNDIYVRNNYRDLRLFLPPCAFFSAWISRLLSKNAGSKAWRDFLEALQHLAGEWDQGCSIFAASSRVCDHDKGCSISSWRSRTIKSYTHIFEVFIAKVTDWFDHSSVVVNSKERPPNWPLKCLTQAFCKRWYIYKKSWKVNWSGHTSIDRDRYTVI